MRRTLLIFCMVACFGQAHGEHLLLDEIKVKGVRESPREESLTIREVQESPARDVGEALRQVEGLDIIRKGAIANDIVLRGMQRDNINVLLDGTRLHGACPNRMDSPAFHIDFAEVDQIRIIKGPYDLENAGSMGGLVDVQSKKPGPGPHANASITAGSYDMIHASGTASYGGEKYDGLLGYAFKKSGVPRDGKGRPITDIYPDNSPARYRKTDATAYLINSGWVKAGWKPTEKGRGEISYSYQDAEHVLYPYLLMDADFDRTHRLNAVYTQENVSPAIRELKLQTYWDKVTHRMDDRLRHSADPTAIVTQNYSMQTDAWTETVGVKANASLGAGPGALKTGLDYYNLNWNGVNRLAGFGYETRAFIPDVTTNNIGIFTEYELPVGEELTLKGGVRGDLAFVDAGKLREARLAFANLYYPGTRDSRFFGEITGNVQATWKPVEGLEVFAGLGRGSRPPAADELYINLQRPMAMPNWIGNPRLTPTETSQADIGIKYGTEAYYINASAFYSYVHDYITVVGIPADDDLKPAFSYRNVDATLVGGELGSQVSLPADLFLKASLSYTEGKNLTYNTPLPEIPPLRGTVSLRYDKDTWFAEILENMAARQDRVDPEVKEQPTAGWATTDIKAGLRTKNVSLFAGVNNLFDKLYYSHLSHRRDPFASGFRVPEFGRNFYVTATVKF